MNTHIRDKRLLVSTATHVFPLLALLDRNRKEDGELNKSAHAYSALFLNGQFRACIARKECGYLSNVGSKKITLHVL